MPSNFIKRLAGVGIGGSFGGSTDSFKKSTNTTHQDTANFGNVSQTIRSAINEGAPLYNQNDKRGCYDIYLATAYQLLSQETLHDMMAGEVGVGVKHTHTSKESQHMIDILIKATSESRAHLLQNKDDHNEGAWILRRAFDEILKMEERPTKSNQKEQVDEVVSHVSSALSTIDDTASEEELRSEGSELATLANTVEKIVDIRDRKFRLKTYQKCFIGKDAVTKLVENHVGMSRTSAVQKLQLLLEIGLIEHVTKDHDFKDSDFFYRFARSTEINLLLKPYRNRSQFLKGKELFRYSALLGRYKQFHKHPSLGVIRLDYDYPPAPGDIDSPESYTYPVYYRAVPGLTFEMCQSGTMTPEVAKAFDDAVLWLAEHQDVSTITGDCGFMMWFTERARSLCTNKTIMLSALMQLPSMIASCAPEDKIIVMTANGKSLMPMLDLIHRQNGMDTMMEQIVIIGCEDVPHFGDPVAKGLKVDVEKAQPGIVAKVLEAVGKTPKARMILMECTELPPYSDAVREATRLPVYDSITQSDFAMSGYLDNSAFGLNGWYETWDGVQENYVLGQNLDASERLRCIWCANEEKKRDF